MENFDLTPEELHILTKNNTGCIDFSDDVFETFNCLTYDFGYLREEVYTEIERLIGLARMYDGVVYGGFVRDVVIPTTKLGLNLNNIDFSDIDFWFKTEVEAQLFINRLNLRGEGTGSIRKKSESNPFKSKSFMTTYKDKPFVSIDVTVSKYYPVCDFSINLLSFDGINIGLHSPFDIYDESEVKTNYTVNSIVKQIKMRQYDIVTKYKEYAINENNKLSSVCASRIVMFGPNMFYKRDKWRTGDAFVIQDYFGDCVKPKGVSR